MTDNYIGLENELICFDSNERIINYQNVFDRIKKIGHYKISENAIRTETGHGFYVDGSELEILTPPIALNKGFATRLTDLLMLGREYILKATPELKYTGYSIHWNLTKSCVDSDYFYEGLAVPFQVFGLTPLSMGFNLREKENTYTLKDGQSWTIARHEILGDSINDEDQIRALALLLGAYRFAIETQPDGRTPLKLLDERFKLRTMSRLFLPDGRYDNVEVHIPSANLKGDMQVQQYLELFYQWIEPFVKILGTNEEVDNLEDFIDGRKRLEFDRFRYFAYVSYC